MRALVSGPGVESGLLAASDKADYANVARAATLVDPEDSSDQETPKKTDAPSLCVADPEGVLVSACFSLDWETVTMSNATFLCIALVAREARVGVVVP